VMGTFEICCFDSGDYAQAFFIFSWTPTWPPTTGYYQPLYDGQPGAYLGVTQSFSFNITVPHAGPSKVCGVYYLYFRTTLQYNVEDAVSLYTKPIIQPVVVITAGP
jgi:hypothetical protein